ncbi:MAG: phenylalanine--tRNA ligase subunit beta [bacterium]
MKVSLNWLKEYVDFKNKSIEELESIFSLQLVEIESIIKLAEGTNLTIGEVLTCEDHPDSDHLHICTVDVKKEKLQIVCGAPNVAKGQKVIVALVGAVLPGDFKIKLSKVRGVESSGMICALDELGVDVKSLFGEVDRGIYVLDNDAPIGSNPLEYLGLDDVVFELGLTPNRADLLSMQGVAFDLAAALNEKVKLEELNVEECSKKNPVKVKIKSKKVMQYHTRYVEGVEVKESPMWLKLKLLASGIRPINNVVDITNFVLMEYGQPLHAFDADLLGNDIVVIDDFAGKFTTLDDVERDIIKGDIVIASKKQNACLGGVMGGKSTEVNANTKNIILEAAQFDPISVRKTSSRLQLRSESSQRFERKIDPNRTLKALDKAAIMLQQLANGTIYKGVNGEVNSKHTPVVINTTLSRINSNLGLNLTVKEVAVILEKLTFEFSVKEENFTVNIPTRRIDYDTNDQDLFEDIARIYGYNNIPTTLCKTSDKGDLTYVQTKIREVKNYFVNCGLYENVTYTLIKEENVHDFTLEDEEVLSVMKPFTLDHKSMRQSLIQSLLDVVSYNLARKNDNINIFEISNVYSTKNNSTKLSGALSGTMNTSLWQGQKELIDFFYAKGLLEGLFKLLGVNASFEAAELKNMHPYKTALIKVGDVVLGYLGEVHPKYQAKANIKETYVFELDFNKLLDVVNTSINYEPISKFPSITRDLAIVCNKDIQANEITKLIKQTGKKILVNVELFDVYIGENVANDEKSLAYKLTFMDSTQTLESSVVDKSVEQILKRLEFTHKAKLRG